MNDTARIAQAANNFPPEFGLRGFPGRRFTIDRRASYVDDADRVVLYIFTLDGKAFSKGTERELAAQIRE